MITLGIWDGHDAGAALVVDGKIVFAANEERFSRRKLEVGFPARSINAALSFAHLTPNDVHTVAASTSDVAKTLSRIFPSLREEYYLLRRRKKFPGPFAQVKKAAKYRLTEWPSFGVTRALSATMVRSELRKLGFINPRVQIIDHHRAHAAGAALCSGFSDALVVTIDGIGDGLSGSLWVFEQGTMKPISMIGGRTSLGIFFEHVTNLLNMRELEDEGKVMALANFASAIPASENPLFSFFTVDGLTLKARYSQGEMYRELRKVLWRYPSEQFASMAQATLEQKVVELISNALHVTNKRRLAYAGGVASNVKVNLLVRELPHLEELFVFPHMGDGGLALGAALESDSKRQKQTHYPLADLFLGPAYTSDEIERELQLLKEVTYRRSNDICAETAKLIARGNVVLWFQGRMEYGPRALGARSILARADSLALKDQLNLRLKKRVWYQPFCPSMLEEDARELLSNYRGPPNAFMTCAYRVQAGREAILSGASSIDGTCRPQILSESDRSRFFTLLQAVKRELGWGVVLNTSLNLHGEPLVCSPKDTLRTFIETDVHALIIEDFIVTKRV